MKINFFCHLVIIVCMECYGKEKREFSLSFVLYDLCREGDILDILTTVMSRRGFTIKKMMNDESIWKGLESKVYQISKEFKVFFQKF